jgi:hypothetical protein
MQDCSPPPDDQATVYAEGPPRSIRGRSCVCNKYVIFVADTHRYIGTAADAPDPDRPGNLKVFLVEGVKVHMRKLFAVLMVLVVIGAALPIASAQEGDGMMGPDVIVTFAPTPFAAEIGLDVVTGWAHVVSDDGHIHILLTPNGAELPAGTVLEGWLVDAGLDGGPGETNVTDDDEAFGVPFGEAAFDEAVEAAPYALSTGALAPNMDGEWELIFDIPAYNFSPYDAVVITAESDGNTLMGFDPRPGTPIFTAAIADGEPAGDMMMGDDMGSDGMADDMADDDMSSDDMSGDDMGDDMMMGSAVDVVLEATPFAEEAGLAGAVVTAQVWVEDAIIEITVDLGDAVLPEGAVLEGWVVDAGLDGGPGETSVTDDDEAFGVPFGEAAFDELVESAPYALSTGVVTDDMGLLTLHLHVPNYNFSPYDAVVLTLESDGNTTGGFDPRPGTPVFAGPIAADMM